MEMLDASGSCHGQALMELVNQTEENKEVNPRDLLNVVEY